MLTADFDFELPDELIAQHAVARGTSRLLVLGNTNDAVAHHHIEDLVTLLRPGDLLVVNDTRVLPARLFARGPHGGRIELLLVERRDPLRWEALTRPGRKTRVGARAELEGDLEVAVEVEVEAVLETDGRRLVRFSQPIEPLLEQIGHVPLPPYVKRVDTTADRERYQTVWAKEPGAVAAPTAGLHFDLPLLERLAAAGIERASVTLHVGIGTFKPVTAALVHEHHMDSERYEVPVETVTAIEATHARGGRVVAVGTTAVRALESAAASGTLRPGGGRTELFLTPGAPLRVVDVLLTNFHLPRSTLLMLVSAFAGRERVLAAYHEAIRERYRFYSYGDAMLVERWPQ